MKRARQEGRQAARSLTTQLVVGAVGESDRELLETVQHAHRELDLRRAYFSAFHPIERSPFADQPAEDPTRALRLYQSDFMIRDYGFSYGELPCINRSAAASLGGGFAPVGGGSAGSLDWFSNAVKRSYPL